MTETRHPLAPTGVLRATINVGNPILASRDNATGKPVGVSVDLARKLAEEIEVPLELLVLESAGKAVETVETGEADIGFFARDPDRAGFITFTNPYVLIEGCYLVKEHSPITEIAEVDADGRRIVVGKGSAYDLYLSRAIKKASIERAATSPAVVKTFLENEADVAAGVRQQLEFDAATLGGLRLLPGRFMVIEQAMGVARVHGAEAGSLLAGFVDRLIADGSVAESLVKHGHDPLLAAPFVSSALYKVGRDFEPC